MTIGPERDRRVNGELENQSMPTLPDEPLDAQAAPRRQSPRQTEQDVRAKLAQLQARYDSGAVKAGEAAARSDRHVSKKQSGLRPTDQKRRETR